MAVSCCIELNHILYELLNGANLSDVVDVNYYKNLDRYLVKSTGYSLDTLEAAKWAVVNTNSFKDAILLAVNLGDDSDTVGAVAGQIAGTLYGFGGIPDEWFAVLAWNNQLKTMAEDLFEKGSRSFEVRDMTPSECKLMENETLAIHAEFDELLKNGGPLPRD
jgi:ADP-ribosylglycohydrolase